MEKQDGNTVKEERGRKERMRESGKEEQLG